MWQQMADQYSRELNQGVAQQRQDQMQQAQLPLSLFDRFQAAYQRQKQQRLAEEEAKRQAEQQEWSRKRMEGIDAAGLEDKRRDDLRNLYTLAEGYDARSPEMKPFLEGEATRLGASGFKLPEVQYSEELNPNNDPLDLSQQSVNEPTWDKVEDPLSGRGVKNRSAYEMLQEKARDRADAAKAARQAQADAARLAAENKSSESAKQRDFLLALKSVGASNANANNDLKRELMGIKIAGEQEKLNAKETTKAGERAEMDKALESFKRLAKHPGLEPAVGAKGLHRGSFGLWTVPGTDAASFNAELKTAKDQMFLPMVKKLRGMGSLSNAEGSRLTDAIGALDQSMGEDAFRDSLARITKDLEDAVNRSNPAAKGGAPPPAPITQAEYDSLKPASKKWFVDNGGKIK